VAIDFPHATRLTLHVLAAIAEHESRMMSDRIRSARAARGRDAVRPKSGKANRLFPPGSRAISAQVRHDRSQARIKDLAPLIWKAIDEGKSYAMIAEEFNRQGIRPAQHKAWQQDSIGAIARATGADFQPRPPARRRSPPGLRRAKMLERVAEIGSLMLGWRAHGLSYAGIARELERRGVASPCGGAWGGQSISRYLIVAAAIASCQGPIGAVG